MAQPGRRIPTQVAHPELPDQLEELGDEAIIAQQTEAHLPQKRASVASEVRSVVIAEDRTRPGSTPYRMEHSEKTVVVRDRRGFGSPRQSLLSRVRDVLGRGARSVLTRSALARRALARSALGRSALGRRFFGRHSLLWAALAVAAFAAGGLLAFLSIRDPAPSALDLPPGKSAQGAEPRSGSGVPRNPSAKAPSEQTPRQVQLDELPLERPNRR